MLNRCRPTLQCAMMSPMTQLAAGLAGAPAASTASKYVAMPTSSESTSTSYMERPRPRYRARRWCGSSGSDACVVRQAAGSSAFDSCV